VLGRGPLAKSQEPNPPTQMLISCGVMPRHRNGAVHRANRASQADLFGSLVLWWKRYLTCKRWSGPRGTRTHNLRIKSLRTYCRPTYIGVCSSVMKGDSRIQAWRRTRTHEREWHRNGTAPSSCCLLPAASPSRFRLARGLLEASSRCVSRPWRDRRMTPTRTQQRQPEVLRHFSAAPGPKREKPA
jgi:hypothetical protein